MENQETNREAKKQWRSLEQLHESPEFEKFVAAEFPSVVQDIDTNISRRQFLTLMGASAALAGLVSCRRPVEKIIPYVVQPEDIIPGIPNYYATSFPFGTTAYGLLVESHEGRPTKIEGNPDHPTTLGSTNSFMQAEILALYDPDRSKTVLHQGQTETWGDFAKAWVEIAKEFATSGGQGLAFLLEPYSSPAVSQQVQGLKKKYPNALWSVYAPISNENILAGTQMATGSSLVPVYCLEKADVILSLENDFLHLESDNVAHTKGFSKKRRVQSEKDTMNRLYVAEASYSLTGTMADHRFRMPSYQIAAFAAGIILELKKLGVNGASATGLKALADRFDLNQKWLQAVAKDLAHNRGRSLVMAGRHQPAVVHALVAMINNQLGNQGKTVSYRDAVDMAESNQQSLQALVKQMSTGNVSTLVIVGGNPSYNSPANIKFKENLAKVKNSIHLSVYNDETSNDVKWHLPNSHFLEAWGDARSTDGTYSLVQPLIAPLYDTKSVLEVLAWLATEAEEPGYNLVQKSAQTILSGPDFTQTWNRVLHDGLQKKSSLAERSPGVLAGSLDQHINKLLQSYPTDSRDFVALQIKPSTSAYDGRYANNAWLQELPDPLTKLTWDNAALISPSMAVDQDLANGDVVTLGTNSNKIEIPVWIAPGQDDHTVTISLGYGRERAGKVGNGVGVNTYALLESGPTMILEGKLIKTGKNHKMASTQDHGSLGFRPLVREASLDEYKKNPGFTKELADGAPGQSMWTEHKYTEGYQWGMAIDLNVCTGCNACTIACQSENNIPVVGKEEVLNGREMHWIRMDRYFVGDQLAEPEVVHQPMACQHCEMAPCEQVCPVAATTHDDEGLNVMIYNRCVGTRYCGNNCPYKVRRFNYFHYADREPNKNEKFSKNPDVTVRSRGVMEKCSFCTQRISEARITAKNAGRDIKDGDIKTACQQGCPADAITFGNINDPESAIMKMKKQNRNYELLAELNVRPRNSYLSKLRNPNPELL